VYLGGMALKIKNCVHGVLKAS